MGDVEKANLKQGGTFRLLDGTPGDIRTVAELHTDHRDGYRFGVSDTLGVFHYFGQIVPVKRDDPRCPTR
jgi:hypothetical protein